MVALEGSKAIPPTIDNFDKRISRSEMVEMMWRLSDGIDTEESKGFLNVKYPKLTVDLTADTIQYPESCSDVRFFLESTGQNRYHYGIPEVMPLAVMEDSASGAESAAPMIRSMANDESFSKTNVQVEGVDEADMVKTDGDYLYIVHNNRISIVDARPPQDMEEVGTIRFDDDFYASELYLHGDILVVSGQRTRYPVFTPYTTHSRIAADYYYEPSVQQVEVHIYDISDRSKPSKTRTSSFDGTSLSSRRIGDTMYLVVNQHIHWYGPTPLSDLPESDILPRFSDTGLNIDDQPIVNCNDIAILPRVRNPQYLTIASIPLKDSRAPINRNVIFGNAQNVYASLNNLYIASPRYHYIWRANGSRSEEHTDVFRFDYVSDGIELRASGSVPGRILNQFSMDEYERHFRIATTRGWGWDDRNPSTNNLYVLNMDMETVGELEGIAPGETIYSTRFMGDRTYMVTFRQVDPFFVIDTSDPRNPEILGKLKIPGFSNYLHPYDENHVIGFGKDTTEQDGRVQTEGMKLALFDVRDVHNPRELDVVIIGERGTDSPLLTNHKALLFDKERDLLTFPVTVNRIDPSQKDEEWAWGRPVFQGAYVYGLTPENGFTFRGSITHYDEEDQLKSGDVWYPSGLKSIERILRIDDSLYTISPHEVQAHEEKSIEHEGTVELSTTKR